MSMNKSRLIGLKIIDVGPDYIVLDTGLRLYTTKKEIAYHIGEGA